MFTKRDNSGLVDRYTTIDDKISETNVLLQQLIQEQRINNALLQKLNAKDYSISNVSLPNVQALNIEKEKYETYVKVITEQTITGNGQILSDQFEGMIAEVYFISDDTVAANGVYGVRILADDKPIYQDMYTELATRSNYESDMSAYDDATYFVTSFQDIAFMRKILIEVYASTATFTRIFVKYHKRIA